MKPDFSTEFEANKLLWNKKTPIHIESEFYDLNTFKKTQNSLQSVELKELPNLKGKKVLHLQCHFGMDSISMAKLGANVTGIDISDTAIIQATKLAKELEIDCEFICANVLEIESLFYDKFDLIYTSYGTIIWLPELTKWANSISNLLKEDGQFYMVDFHPMVNYLDDDYAHQGFPYFNESIHKDITQSTYTDGNKSINHEEYFWMHPTSEVINALINSNLKLEFYNEHDFSVYPCFPNLIEVGSRKWQFKNRKLSYPMMFSLSAIK